LKLTSFRPLPKDAISTALRDVSQVTVLDRADSPGGIPPLAAELAATLYGTGIALEHHVYGLGGRDLHPVDVCDIFAGGAPGYVGVRGDR
jgi:pyruvate/2-oxoacid:ferredoxin oxidoreductase alpha subunit